MAVDHPIDFIRNDVNNNPVRRAGLPKMFDLVCIVGEKYVIHAGLTAILVFIVFLCPSYSEDGATILFTFARFGRIQGRSPSRRLKGSG